MFIAYNKISRDTRDINTTRLSERFALIFYFNFEHFFFVYIKRQKKIRGFYFKKRGFNIRIQGPYIQGYKEYICKDTRDIHKDKRDIYTRIQLGYIQGYKEYIQRIYTRIQGIFTRVQGPYMKGYKGYIHGYKGYILGYKGYIYRHGYK